MNSETVFDRKIRSLKHFGMELKEIILILSACVCVQFVMTLYFLFLFLIFTFVIMTPSRVQIADCD